MSDALVHRRQASAPPAVSVSRPRAMPPGYGLALGAAVSGGLWAGIFWLLAQVFR